MSEGLAKPALVLPDSPRAALVDSLQGELGAELGYFVTGWDEAWLWGDSDGFALFGYWRHRTRAYRNTVISNSAGWELQRVWLRPSLRRRGMLSAAWPAWQERYGALWVEEPLSDAMRAFLGRVPRRDDLGRVLA